MRFRLTSLIACAVLGLAIAAPCQTKSAQQSRYAARAGMMRVFGTWQGTTPCADCSGIVTTLTLYQKSAKDFSHMVYRQRLKYIDRGSFTTYGTWTIVHGMPGNPEATVYQLNSDKPENTQYYLQVDSDALQQLDREMKPIDSKLNFTLKRIGVSQSKNIGTPNPASVNCTTHGGTLKIETGKDGGQVGICTFPNGRQCEEWAFMRKECSPDAK
jgi:putative hemolysin